MPACELQDPQRSGRFLPFDGVPGGTAVIGNATRYLAGDHRDFLRRRAVGYPGGRPCHLTRGASLGALERRVLRSEAAQVTRPRHPVWAAPAIRSIIARQ